MEFLLTYGWAILVILIVMAALVYFGVLDPSSLLPGKCVFNPTVQCRDYVASSATAYQAPGIEESPRTVTFDLINNIGKDVNIVGIEIINVDRDLKCSRVQLPECEEGTSWIEINSLYIKTCFLASELPSSPFFSAGRTCISLNETCVLFEEIAAISGIPDFKCDPNTLIHWKQGERLKSVISAILSPLFDFEIPGMDYLNFYCLNLPEKSTRINAQIKIEYFINDPSFTYTTYGELSAPVQ